MNHQWPPEVARAMQEFSDAAPVAPSLTSVLEHRPVTPSSQPPAARLDPDERLVPMEEITVSVNTPSETSTRRRLLMAAAAVVVVIGIAGIALANNNDDDDEAPSSAPAATLAPATTVAPTTTVATTTVSFAVTSANDIPVTFSAPVDWTVVDGWSAYGDEAGVLFDSITNIYAEGCQWVLVDPPVGSTVDDLVEAFANVPDLAATEAVDVAVDGYAGKQFEFAAPDYTASECRQSKYALWDVPDQESDPGYWAQGPNSHFQMWVLDVDGTRLVIGAATFPNTSPQDHAALDQALASIQIG